jgi:hypothetical protein
MSSTAMQLIALALIGAMWVLRRWGEPRKKIPRRIGAGKAEGGPVVALRRAYLAPP